MNKKIIYFAFLFLLVFLFGFFLGNKSRLLQKSGVPESVSKGQENTFQAGWEAARKKVAESDPLAYLASAEMKNISGQVTEVKGNKVTLKTTSADPLDDSGLGTRIVEVAGNTKIYQLVAKSPEQFQKEMSEFIAKMGNNAEGFTPPSSSEKKEVGLADIKVGQEVSATADEDIKSLKQFEALEIDIQPAQ